MTISSFLTRGPPMAEGSESPPLGLATRSVGSPERPRERKPVALVESLAESGAYCSARKSRRRHSRAFHQVVRA